jgi:lipoprotein-anchoring transpeptidase ErfK/SrfK
VYAFGSASFVGSIADVRPAHPVTAVARTPTGRGLWLATADGTVFALGDAPAHGSGPAPAGTTVADLAALADGSGYWVAVTEQPSTPPPAAGATGRRVVYANRTQRVWLIEADGTVTRTFPVSGRAGVPAPGTYTVFSQSRFTSGARDGRITMEYMTRFTRSARGANIGFHSIPLKRGVPMQSEAQLGTFQSAGCVRMAPADAAFLYAWAPVGTTVVVTP